MLEEREFDQEAIKKKKREPENGSGFTAGTAVRGPENTDWVRVYLDLCIT